MSTLEIDNCKKLTVSESDNTVYVQVSNLVINYSDRVYKADTSQLQKTLQTSFNYGF